MDRYHIAICTLAVLLLGAWIVGPGNGSTGENLGENMVDWSGVFRGYQAYLDNSISPAMTSGTSMAPALRTGDTVLWVKVPFENLRVGDIIIYRHTVTVGENRGQTFIVIHRVINIIEDGAFTKGDNMASSDAYKVTPGDLMGLVRGVLFTSSKSWGR